MILIDRFEKQPNRKDAKEQGHQRAWSLLKQAVWQTHGLSLSEDLIAYGAYGKPYLRGYPEIHFSLTHCNGLAACILADRQVGIDAEWMDRIHEKAMRRIFSFEEMGMVQTSEEPIKQFYKLWTRKESYAKATGQGLLRTRYDGADAVYETRFLPDGYCLTICYL